MAILFIAMLLIIAIAVLAYFDAEDDIAEAKERDKNVR